MSAIANCDSIVNRFSLAAKQQYPQGYYRSKLFISTSTGNPLVAAASPLFSILERLGTTHTLPPVNTMRDNIEHELQAFQSRLARKDYASEFSTIAIYLLSSTVDELIGKNYLRIFKKPVHFQAFTPLSQNEKEPQTVFFEIVEQLKDKENQYLDLIELAYYCLISGFEGELHVRADGRLALENLIDELYQIICTHRVNKPLKLFKENPRTISIKSKQKSYTKIIVLALSGIISIGILSQVIIEHKASIILDNHTKQGI